MRKRHAIGQAVAFILALGVGSAHASIVFSDNFDMETPGLDTVLKNFTVSGSIDVIPVGKDYDFYPGNGYYVDLDGSNHQNENPTSTLTSKTLFGPGTYTVTFNLGGNARGADSKTTRVSLGDATFDYTLASSAGLTFQSFSAIVTGAPSSLVFTELGTSTNVGNILDNVTVSSVPLPASAPLFGAALLGLAGLGYTAKRTTRPAS